MRNKLLENFRKNLSENSSRKKRGGFEWEYVDIFFEQSFRSVFRGLLWHIDSRPATPICGAVFRAVVPSHRSRLSTPPGVTWPSAGPDLESFCEQHKNLNAAPNPSKQAKICCVMTARALSPWQLWRLSPARGLLSENSSPTPLPEPRFSGSCFSDPCFSGTRFSDPRFSGASSKGGPRVAGLWVVGPRVVDS